MENKNKKKTILIVDDNDINRVYLLEILKECCIVIEAENGQEAVNICLNTHAIDVVLMDICMPIMSGDEAARYIKEKRPSLPVIAITACAHYYDTIFDRILYKPITYGQLHEQLEYILSV
jgi:CheY-like chemotaxis protein